MRGWSKSNDDWVQGSIARSAGGVNSIPQFPLLVMSCRTLLVSSEYCMLPSSINVLTTTASSFINTSTTGIIYLMGKGVRTPRPTGLYVRIHQGPSCYYATNAISCHPLLAKHAASECMINVSTPHRRGRSVACCFVCTGDARYYRTWYMKK